VPAIIVAGALAVSSIDLARPSGAGRASDRDRALGLRGLVQLRHRSHDSHLAPQPGQHRLRGLDSNATMSWPPYATPLDSPRAHAVSVTKYDLGGIDPLQ
jgi:hypothetical protein